MYDAIQFWCQQNCDTFIMDGGLLQYEWITIHDEDKRAIAAYMQATKETRDFLPILYEDNYREYVIKGKNLRRDTLALPPTDAD